MTTRPATITGILCLAAGIAIFSVQDLILKKLSGHYPLHQAMVLRGLLNFVAYTAYYLGLATLPMPETVALFFMSPLFITLAAWAVLKEPVPLTSALAVLAGFAGVLMIVKPGAEGFQPAALLPVLGALGYAISMVVARPLGRTETAAAMSFWGNNCFLLCALGLSAIYGSGAHADSGHPSMAFLTRGWVYPSLADLTLMCGCGLIAAIGLTLLTFAYRIAPAAAVAPFEYTFMFWGLLWGWLFWRDLPDALGWTGIAVIIGAGLYVISTPQKEKAAP